MCVTHLALCLAWGSQLALNPAREEGIFSCGLKNPSYLGVVAKKNQVNQENQERPNSFYINYKAQTRRHMWTKLFKKLQKQRQLYPSSLRQPSLQSHAQQDAHVLRPQRMGWSWVCQLFLSNLQSQKWLHPPPCPTFFLGQWEILERDSKLFIQPPLTGRKHQTWEGALGVILSKW